MTNDPSKNSEGIQEAALRVISNLYDSVTYGADYEQMFFAMDDVIDRVLGDPQIERGSDVVKPMLQSHFDRAAHVFDVMSRQEIETPLTFIERKAVATAVMDHAGKAIAANAAFRDAFGQGGLDLEQSFATPADASRFDALARSNAPDSQTIINVVNAQDGQPVSLLAGTLPDIQLPDTGGQAVYLMMIQPRWTTNTGALLKDAFDLSAAEIEILRSFVETGSVKGVADQRGRSIRTVRTQLSRVFAQMGVSGQTGLALFLATLGALEGDKDRKTIRHLGVGASPTEVGSHLIEVSGHTTEYLDYGDPSGAPILLLQSSHPPGLTEKLRQHLFDAGLRVIAPLKPGSGRSDHIAGRPGPDALAPTYRAVLSAIGADTVVVAGQASGGLYALEFAKQFPDQVSAVCLIDTGVPFRDRSELMQLPKTIRRTMVPARYFPDLLYLPHRLVASNFRRSRRGEASVVDYFFKDSPAERGLTRTNREAYDVTRAIINYSFDDPDRLVDDVSRWASNWQPLLGEVARQSPIRFFHGAGNRMFRTDPIEAWVSRHTQCDLVMTPDAGQLAMYMYPQTFVDALSSLMNHSQNVERSNLVLCDVRFQ